MTKKYQGIKGMNDILPGESKQWLYFEQALHRLLADYGYQYIRTPIVETTSLFIRAIGEVTDVVEKEMYTFIDNLNGESLTLRPEGTAGTLRAALEHNLLYHAPQKLWYMGPMFRHERPQKGRYRQFHQVGAEALGFAGPDVDAELIVMTSELWRRLGLSGDVRLEINTLGDLSERTAYRRALVAYLERYSDQLDEESRRRLYTNPLRVLDTKHPALQDIVNRAPRLIDYLGDESLAHYQHWKALLDGLGIAWQENPRLVRGLDYYNRSVFEWVTDALGAQGALCAGGRYDGLAQLLGGKPTPAVGFAMGMERIVLLLREKDGLPTHTAADIYLVSRGQGADLYAMQLAQTLRRAGHSVIQHLGSGNFKSQMKKADHSGARVAMIVGEVEVASCQVVMKPLRQQQAQQTVALEHVVAALAKILGSSATRQ